MIKKILLFLVIFIFLSCECEKNECQDVAVQEKPSWTIMIYSGGDNDLESVLLTDIKETMAGYPGVVPIYVLSDRSPNYVIHDAVVPDFVGVRLFKLSKNALTPINADFINPEINQNSGDATLLGNFISYCKSVSKTKHYALFIGSHGQGSRSVYSKYIPSQKSIVLDSTSKDWIYTAELTDILEPKHSIDLLAIDACFMGNLEFLYQIRAGNNDFNADYVVASPSEEWGNGWLYTDIFNRIVTGTTRFSETKHSLTNEPTVYYGQSIMTPEQFGRVIVEEFYDKVIIKNVKSHALSLYKTSKLEAVKENIDILSKSLVEKKVSLETIRTDSIHYFDSSNATYWKLYPYLDMYDLCENIVRRDDLFNTEQRRYALDSMHAIEDLIVLSVADSAYGTKFKNGKNGVSIFFPKGNQVYDSKPGWQHFAWYNSIDTMTLDPAIPYGKLSWCIDNATPKNNNVENWFELLDSFYDTTNDITGGLNGYQY